MKLNVALSARNQIPGTLKEIKKGQTTSHLKVDIGGGHIVTASITNEAVDELELKNGDSVWAIIKASDVMIAK
jgi:molybdopterin-binding protein